jgi:hypothetical protein
MLTSGGRTVGIVRSRTKATDYYYVSVPPRFTYNKLVFSDLMSQTFIKQGITATVGYYFVELQYKTTLVMLVDRCGYFKYIYGQNMKLISYFHLKPMSGMCGTLHPYPSIT